MPESMTPQQKREIRKRMLVRRHHRMVLYAVIALVILLSALHLAAGKSKRLAALDPARPLARLRYMANSAMQIRETNGVYAGSDGYQFAVPKSADQQVVKDTIAQINQLYEANPNIRTYAMIVPSGAELNRDKLPLSAPLAGQDRSIADFYDHLAGDIDTLDVSGALGKTDQHDLFFKTDERWTSAGAYKAFRKMASGLGIDAPVGYDKYTVSTSFAGNLSARSGNDTVRDQLEIFLPKSKEINYYVAYPDSGEKRATVFCPEKLETDDQYDLFFGGSHPLIEIHTTANNGRNLLVIRDSFADAFVQFLTPYFDRIILVDPALYEESISAVVLSYDINEILYLYGADTILTDEHLPNALREAAGAMQQMSEAAEEQQKEAAEEEQEQEDAEKADSQKEEKKEDLERDGLADQ